MTKEEEATYLKARVLYLEKVVEFQKKIPSILEQNGISYKPKN